jgi:hypothetical protein
MFDQLSAEIVPSLIKGVTTPTTPTTTKQNVYPAVYYVYSRVKIVMTENALFNFPKFILNFCCKLQLQLHNCTFPALPSAMPWPGPATIFYQNLI